MREYRFILDPGSKKFNCPGCGKKRFVRYIDRTTGQYVDNQYGRCDRSDNCGFYKPPPLETKCFFVPYSEIVDFSKKAYLLKIKNKEYYLPKSQVYETTETGCYASEFILTREKAPPYTNDAKYFTGTDIRTTPLKTKDHKPANIPVDILKQTLHQYEKNVFIQNLLLRVDYPFDKTDIEKVISLYYLGTVVNGVRAGAITFPFIDKQGKVKAIQVKQFDTNNHTIATDFLHSIIERFYNRKNKPFPEWLKSYLNNEKKVTCLFGEHLLQQYPQNPVALVEAPKTAIYGTLYFGLPENKSDYIWLAVYNLSSLTFTKAMALTGRKIVLFPDASEKGNAYHEWKNKASEFNEKLAETTFVVSDYLENHASQSEKKKGYDLADVLITKDWRDFRWMEPTPGEQVYEQLAAINPNLREFKEKLDLIPGKVTLHEPMMKEKVFEVALELIGYDYNLISCKPNYCQNKVKK